MKSTQNTPSFSESSRSSWLKRAATGCAAAALALAGLAGLGTHAGYAQDTTQSGGTGGTEAQASQIEINPDGKHFQVYYRAWRDVTMKGVNTSLPDENWMSMYDIPYGVDVVNVFSYVPPGQEEAAQPFYDKLKAEYAPYLHSRGILLVRGVDYMSTVVNGFKTFIEDRGGTAESATEADYDDYADFMIKTYVTDVGLDGIDIDMETYPSEEEVAISDNVVRALGKKLGPKSANPDTTMLIYDTNNTFPAPLENVDEYFNYVAFQQYGYGTDRTDRVLDEFEGVIDSTMLVPGLTFPEEGDPNNRWFDTDDNYPESNYYQVASYVRDNNLGGMFAYALDRDGRSYEEPDFSHILPSNLLWTKTAIAESQSMTLETAKAAANHYLDRMAPTKPVPAEVRAAVADATNLYEANVAVLGADWDEGYSNTYDPTWEVQLINSEGGLPNPSASASASPSASASASASVSPSASPSVSQPGESGSGSGSGSGDGQWTPGQPTASAPTPSATPETSATNTPGTPSTHASQTPGSVTRNNHSGSNVHESGKTQAGQANATGSGLARTGATSAGVGMLAALLFTAGCGLAFRTRRNR